MIEAINELLYLQHAYFTGQYLSTSNEVMFKSSNVVVLRSK